MSVYRTIGPLVFLQIEGVVTFILFTSGRAYKNYVVTSDWVAIDTVEHHHIIFQFFIEVHQMGFIEIPEHTETPEHTNNQ